MGAYADRFGRRGALIITMAMMASPAMDTPTPMPALAPVERWEPPESLDVPFEAAALAAKQRAEGKHQAHCGIGSGCLACVVQRRCRPAG